uniref:Helicase ATP-binding domain-containing protein n=1 Tax=Chaetoceros debilis TaxID=122233 RepID=A0A7S3QF64_9STRA
MSEPLIDPSLLKNLTEVEKDEALAAAAAAKRAEERAEQRMLERAMERKRLEREKERALELEHQRTRMNEVSGLARMNHAISSSSGVNGIEHRSGSLDDNDGGSNGNSSNKVVFISKKRRAEMKEKGNPDGNDDGNGNASHKKIKSHSGASVSASLSASRNASARSSRNDRMSDSRGASNRSSSSSSSSSSNRISNNRSNSRQQKQHQLTTSELNAIKKTYLGESALQDEETLQRKHKEERQRAKQKKKTMFKFEWDASEDTSMDADGISMPTMMSTIRNKSRNNGSGRDERRGGRHGDSRSRTGNRDRDRDERGSSVMTKPIAKMTKRDWRIFRENYDITVRGGKAPPPLRNFRESSTSEVPAIHPVIINAIENVLRYREPSPIQRQAIPIGLQRRDLIGVAETGSGKTAAFGIPLIQLIFSLPQKALDTVAENGPLALVMAPTRELAIQIDAEFQRILSRQKNIKTACIVGGQPIQKQAMELRGGVHVIVGTPGRLNDCLEEAYLVLNQCSYIVLDEADRMIDLRFAPQIESILDVMGGSLKSENEKEAYDQELKGLREISKHVPTHRLTAMFSATMPAEVQRSARKYLRHPAVVSIIGGPGGGGKNKQIDQRVLFLSSPGMKEKQN